MLAPSLSFGMRIKDCPAMSLTRGRASHAMQAMHSRAGRLGPQRARDRRECLVANRKGARRNPWGLGLPSAPHDARGRCDRARRRMRRRGHTGAGQTDSRPGPLAGSRRLHIPNPGLQAPRRPASRESVSRARLTRFLNDLGKSASPPRDWRWRQLPRTSQRDESHDMASPSNRQWVFFRGKAA